MSPLSLCLFLSDSDNDPDRDADKDHFGDNKEDDGKNILCWGHRSNGWGRREVGHGRVVKVSSALL